MCELKVNAVFSWMLYPDFKKITSDSEWTVCSFKVKDVLTSDLDLKGRKITATGNFLPKKEEEIGVLFTLEGEYIQDNGRWTLKCCSCVPATPTDRQETVAFLQAVLPGVGPKIADRIYSEFGDQTISILENEPKKLSIVPGISEAKARMLGESYHARGTHVQQFAQLLKEWNISEEVAVKAYEVLGPKGTELVKKSIYHLVDRKILEFNQVEAYARRRGDFEPYDPIRLQKGILQCLYGNETGRTFDQSGNLYVRLNDLAKASIALLNLRDDVTTIYRTLHVMDNLKLIHWDEYQNIIYRYKTFEAEKTSAERVARQLMKPSFSIEKIPKALEKECKERKIELGDEQKAAVMMALQQPFSVITGFPGTGKTTIQQVILALLKTVYDENAVLLAPTGRASKRMQESTGHPAKTIHSALGLTDEAEPTGADDKARITTDLLIVDESSMMDIFVFSSLMRFVEAKRICIIGDIDQLPSVGPGAVLRDLIETPLVPVTRLSKIYRQEKINGIIINSKFVRDGEHKMLKDVAFHFEELPDEQIQQRIIEEYEKQVKVYGQENVILLSPYRRTNNLSTTLLNQDLQERMNPDRGQGKFQRRKDGSMFFRVGDPILCMKNMADKDVMNGDVGICIEADDMHVLVNFDGREVDFERKDAQFLDLSYATTVHKSQGSEYKCVLLILSLSQKYLINRGILYTAISRSREECFVFGQINCYSYAISCVDQYRRQTQLSERIKRAFHEQMNEVFPKKKKKEPIRE